MLVRVYATRAEADAALAAAGGGIYEHDHQEGVGPDDYRIVNPGNAAARIRARGVWTERPLAVIALRGEFWVPVKATVQVDVVSGPAGNYARRTVTRGSDGQAVDRRP